MDRRAAVKNIALSIGLLASGSTIISLFNACSGKKSNENPEFFKASDMFMISFLVDIILPTTSSIGAKDLNVSEFIDKICTHVLSAENQKEMKLGAQEFSKKFQELTNKIPTEGNKNDYEFMVKTYFDIPQEKQKTVLKMLDIADDNQTNEIKPDYHLYKFLTTIREITLLGYFTSKSISDSEMDG